MVLRDIDRIDKDIISGKIELFQDIFYYFRGIKVNSYNELSSDCSQCARNLWVQYDLSKDCSPVTINSYSDRFLLIILPHENF